MARRIVYLRIGTVLGAIFGAALRWKELLFAVWQNEKSWKRLYGPHTPCFEGYVFPLHELQCLAAIIIGGLIGWIAAAFLCRALRR